jgi:S1-C subfamily serine protease
MNTIRHSPARAGLAPAAVLALLALATPAGFAADAPADRVQLEKQLAEARVRLDAAAREVAELSGELYADQGIDIVRMIHGEPRGAMLGVNIGGAQGRTDGVEITGVSPGGPAEKAGLVAGDVILSVDGQRLKQAGERGPARQLVGFMRSVEPGHVVKLEVLRGGQRRTVEVKTAPAEPAMARVLRERLVMPGLEDLPMAHFPGLAGLGGPFGSLELVPVTPKLGQYFGTDKGLLVVRAPGDAALALEEGDVLQSIGGRTPESPGHAFRILRSYEPGEKVKLTVLRQRKRLELEATVPDASAPRPRATPPAPRPRPTSAARPGTV